MYGRNGDTQLRNIDGEPAHVNNIEAQWIDDYGPLGIAATKEIGSGTTNPNTGLKEYFWPHVLSTGLQLAGPIYSAWQANNNDADASNLDTNMAPYQKTINTLGQAANSRITPNSAYNLSADKQIEDSAYDAMGVQNMLTNRGSNQGGMGGYSGIAAQGANAEVSRTNSELQKFITQSRFGREKQGYEMLGNVGKMQQGMGELRMQRDMSQPNMDIGGLLGNFGQGLSNYYQDQSGFGEGPMDVMGNIGSEQMNTQMDDIFSSFQINQPSSGNAFSIGNAYGR